MSLPRRVYDELVVCPGCGRVGHVKRYDWPEFGMPRQTQCSVCGTRWSYIPQAVTVTPYGA
mgnify:CR=1 FL=1